MEKTHPITIIGAGLSGLTLAYHLRKAGATIKILEASSRMGGRIQTQTGQLGTPMELGATWFSDEHPNLLALVKELGLQKFPQFSEGISLFQTKSFEPPQQFYIPAAGSPSYRMAGGTQALIEALANRVGRETVLLNAPVTRITAAPHAVIVHTGNGQSVVSEAVAICIPPQLAASRITFSPGLPAAVSKVLPAVQTWMAAPLNSRLNLRRLSGEPGKCPVCYIAMPA